MISQETKDFARKLRSDGKTFIEIEKILDIKIPKSTLSTWFHGVVMSQESEEKIKADRKNKLKEAQKKAVIVSRNIKDKYFRELLLSNKPLENLLENKEISKIVLATLYLGEGTKNKRSALVFGNSDPEIIKLFLQLLRRVFNIDEKKFRCTLQGREDQDIKTLELFWSGITKIPLNQFYGARIDPRSKGKASKKHDYKGVCRIDYLSANVFHEIMAVCSVITGSVKYK